jgi:hypothetical protein
MKKIFFFFSILMLSAALSHAQIAVQLPRISVDVIIGNRPPSPNEAQAMRAEEARHPSIAHAMYNIQNSLQALHAAPDVFGGHKAQAEADLRQAYISLRRALYFRLYRE